MLLFIIKEHKKLPFCPKGHSAAWSNEDIRLAGIASKLRKNWLWFGSSSPKGLSYGTWAP